MLRPSRAILVVVALVLGVASRADAHAQLISSTPEAGTTVATSPAEVRLTFDGPPYSYGLGVVVVGPGEAHVETGRASVDGNDVVQPLTSLPAAGTYTVQWRVVSADGHPVSGQYVFAYEPDGSKGPVTAHGAKSDGVARGWLLLGVAGLAVLGLIALLVMPGRRRP